MDYLELEGNQISDLSPLANVTSLVTLGLEDNQISDIGPLSNLINIQILDLKSNQISDIYPLIQNAGVDFSDNVYLNDNPLSTTSCAVYIPELESRWVIVRHDCP
jgi:internalin A